MHLEIISPDKELYKGEVDLVNCPGTDGYFGILNGHSPIVATLQKGTIKILQAEGGKNNFDDESGKLIHSTANDKEISFDVNGGVVEVLKDKVIILAE